MAKGHYFEQVAKQWDQMRTGFFSDRVRDVALNAANVKPGNVAADIGAGTGFITEALLERGLSVIAVDRSQAMLNEVRKKFKTLDGRIGDAEKLPVENGSVDYVFANMCLHHVENPAAAIIEMARILKAGGRLVITDLDEHHFDFLRIEHHDRWMGFRRDKVDGWFREAGLKNINIESIDEACCTNSKCGRENAGINIFIATGEK